MFGLRLLWRDWRGGELGILLSALVTAVAIVVGIALFTDRIQQGFTSQSSNFLAADRVLQTNEPIDNAWIEQAKSTNLEFASVYNFASMVYVGDNMERASVKAVSDAYPLKGKLDVSDLPYEPGYKVENGPKPGEVWVDSRLLPLMDLEMGDEIFVGELSLPITKIIVSEPDTTGNPLGFGARVLMNVSDLAATEIIGPGSRVEYRYLFAGEEQSLNLFGDWIKAKKAPGQRWLGIEESQPRIAQALQRAERFLLLAGALGVGLAGVAIALAARRYSERHYDYVAMMKSLGASSDKIIKLYFLNLVVLALIAIVVGCFIGWFIQSAFISIIQEVVAIKLVAVFSMKPFIIGAVTAFICLLVFALPPLINLQGISPLRVIRRDIENTTISSLMSYGIGVGGIAVLMFWYSGDIKLTTAILLGVLMTFGFGALIAWYLVRSGKVVGMQAGSMFALAAASMRRRGIQNAVQVVIFSLAIMLLLNLTIIRTSLIEDWRVQLPEKTPNHFLVNVKEDDVNGIQGLLEENNLGFDMLFPTLRARLQGINGVDIKELVKENADAQNEYTRGLNLTWSQDLPYENKVVKGQWWDEPTTESLVSIEKTMADRLGIDIGDSLQFKIGSDFLDVKVSSIRTLNWDTMRPNFYMILNPGVMDAFSATYITSFYLPPEEKSFLNKFVRAFPTIVVIEVDNVIRQIRMIVTQVGGAIELVLGLIIISGVLVLIASVQASLDSRYQESAILRTLGARRSIVLGSLILEFCGLGFLAGLMAAFTAEISVMALQLFVLDMAYKPNLWVWFAGPSLGAMIIGFAGYVTCRKVVNSPPVQVLREI